MSAQSVHNGALHINGALSSKTFTPPASSIGNNAVEANAGVNASKLEHQHQKVDAQSNAGANVARRVVVHVVKGATGDITAFVARNTTAASGSDYTDVDLLVNGSSVLSSAVRLNLAASTTLTSGTVSSADLVQDDVVEIEFTLSGSNVGNGGMGMVTIREDAQ